MTRFNPQIIAFLCRWCAYDGADSAGRARMETPPNIREVRVMCSGQVGPDMILKAFTAGADGVLILGCEPGGCHYREGNVHAIKRSLLVQAVFEQTPVHKKRVHLDWVSAGQGERYVQVANKMVASVRELGPLTADLQERGAHLGR